MARNELDSGKNVKVRTEYLDYAVRYLDIAEGLSTKVRKAVSELQGNLGEEVWTTADESCVRAIMNGLHRSLNNSTRTQEKPATALYHLRNDFEQSRS